MTYLSDTDCESLRAELVAAQNREPNPDAERDRVGLMLADAREIDPYLPSVVGEGMVEHFYCQSFWHNQLYHALFCFLAELRANGMTWKDIKELEAHGKQMIEQRKKTDGEAKC